MGIGEVEIKVEGRDGIGARKEPSLPLSLESLSKE
jgi:hypothetical protein